MRYWGLGLQHKNLEEYNWTCNRPPSSQPKFTSFYSYYPNISKVLAHFKINAKSKISPNPSIGETQGIIFILLQNSSLSVNLWNQKSFMCFLNTVMDRQTQLIHTLRLENHRPRYLFSVFPRTALWEKEPAYGLWLWADNDHSLCFLCSRS